MRNPTPGEALRKALENLKGRRLIDQVIRRSDKDSIFHSVKNPFSWFECVAWGESEFRSLPDYHRRGNSPAVDALNTAAIDALLDLLNCGETGLSWESDIQVLFMRAAGKEFVAKYLLEHYRAKFKEANSRIAKLEAELATLKQTMTEPS